MTRKQKTPTATPKAQKAAPLVPVEALAAVRGVDTVVRGLLLLFAFSLVFLFDLAVPEVSGDIRWTATHVVAGVSALLLLLGRWEKMPKRLHLTMPMMGWLAVGLAIWAAVSVVDAIDPVRAIVLIKALYSQLLLILVTYTVWTPQFGRRLMWALVLPLGFVGMLGIGQFWGLTDATFQAAVLPNWLAWAWPAQGGMWDVLLGYYQQSAVPGSSFANKNLAASYVVMLLPMAVYLLLTTKHVGRQALLSVVMALALVFLLYTRTRSSWLAFAVGTPLLLACAFGVPTWRRALLDHAREKQLAWLIPAILLVITQWDVTSPLTGHHGIADKPADQIAKIAEGKWDEVGGRIAYNLNSLAIVKDHWFNGVGLGSFYGAYPAYNDALVETPTNSYSVTARPQRTHTDLMQAFDEMGIPGGSFYAGLLLCALAYAAWLGTRAAAPVFKAAGGEKYTLWPLFAGAGLFNISFNALMDFPMQLPTAPAVVVMLMGGLVWWYKKAFPARVYTLKLPAIPFGKPGAALVLLALLAANIWAAWDSYWYREGNMILKAGMVRVMSGVVDEETVNLLEKANQTYSYDPRIHEYMGVAYANYAGKTPISTETRIEKLEQVVKYDPYGANHVINLIGQYIVFAESAQQNGDPAAATRAMRRVDELLPNLKRSAGFSEYYWGIAGLVEVMEGHPAAALPLLERSLAINPGYEPAKQAFLRANVLLGRMKVSGTEVVPVSGT